MLVMVRFSGTMLLQEQTWLLILLLDTGFMLRFLLGVLRLLLI